jgi:hypothetical protein
MLVMAPTKRKRGLVVATVVATDAAKNVVNREAAPTLGERAA